MYVFNHTSFRFTIRLYTSWINWDVIYMYMNYNYKSKGGNICTCTSILLPSRFLFFKKCMQQRIGVSPTRAYKWSCMLKIYNCRPAYNVHVHADVYLQNIKILADIHVHISTLTYSDEYYPGITLNIQVLLYVGPTCIPYPWR